MIAIAPSNASMSRQIGARRKLGMPTNGRLMRSAVFFFPSAMVRVLLKDVALRSVGGIYAFDTLVFRGAARRSVFERKIDEVAERLPRAQALDVVGDDHRRGGRIGGGGDVRRHDDPLV